MMSHRPFRRAALAMLVLPVLACHEDRLAPSAPGTAAAVRSTAVAGMYAAEFIATAATGIAMNDSGDVVGTSYLDTGCGSFCLPPQETVAWRAGTRIVLPGITGFSGIYPVAINRQGQIAGSAGIPGTNTHAVVWTPAGAGYTAQDLGALPGMSVTTAAGIDNLGRVVGWSSTGGAIPTASAPYVWSSATGMQNLVAQGFPNDIPTAMSPGGTVATSGGWYQLGNPASATPLPAPPTGFFGTGTYPAAINDNGDQARFLITTSGQNLAYFFRLPRGGTWQQLSGSPSGHLTRFGTGSINGALDVTGTVTSTGVVAAGPGGLAQGLAGLISPAYGTPFVTMGGTMNASGQILAHVAFGTSSRLVRLTPVTPCGANCLVATVALNAQFIQDPANPGQCFQGGTMFNRSTATVTITDENGNPIANAQVRGRFMDDYWTSNAVTGSTNASGVASWTTTGPCGVGSIEFLVEGVSQGTRSFDRTRGLLVKSMVPVVGPSNQPPVASFTWSCNGLSCSFDGTGSSDPDGSIASYRWTLPNGSTVGTTATFSRTFPSARTFALTLTVTDNNGSSSSVTQTIVVTGGGGGNQPPVARFTWSCTPQRACTFDGTGSSDPDGTITSYAWKLPNGSTVSTASTFTRSFPSARTFGLTLTVTDNGGLGNSTTQTITVP